MTVPVASTGSTPEVRAGVPENLIAYSHSWYSSRLSMYVDVGITPAGRVVLYDRRWYALPAWSERLRLAMRTAKMSRCASLSDERRARQRLRALLTREQWRSYVLSGEFVEQSQRSEVMYWFRRLRPTIAMTWRSGGRGVRVALCCHVAGYYRSTFVGFLSPSADVLAQLLLMRTDEHRFWKISGHHPLGDPRAGV